MSWTVTGFPRLGGSGWAVQRNLVLSPVKDGQDYFTGLRQVEDYLDAVIAILIWPVLLFGFDINIGGGSRRN